MKTTNTIIIVGLIAILLYVIYKLMNPEKTLIDNTNLSTMMNGLSTNSINRSSVTPTKLVTYTGYNSPTPEVVRNNPNSRMISGGGSVCGPRPSSPCPTGWDYKCIPDNQGGGSWSCWENGGGAKQNEPNENLSCTDLFAMKTRIDQFKINAGIASNNLNSSNTKANQDAVINANNQLNLAINTYNKLASSCNTSLITIQQNSFVKPGIKTITNVSTYNGAVMDASGNAITPKGNGQFIKM